MTAVNPLRTRLKVQISSAGPEVVQDSAPPPPASGPVFVLTVLAPLTEDVVRATAIAIGGGDIPLADQVARCATAREIMLPLIVGVSLDGQEVDGWEGFIAESDLLVGGTVMDLLRACCFRGARVVECLDPV